MGAEPSRRRRLLEIGWVVLSSVIWAAVVISTGETAWPLVVWALTTFAPLASGRSRENANKP